MSADSRKNLANILTSLMLLSLLSGAGPLIPAPRTSPVIISQNEDRSRAVIFNALDLYANIETVGVVVSGTNLPQSAVLMYRHAGEANWRTGHPLMRIADGRLVGSLFGLSPATSYEIKVLDGATEVFGSTTTQADELQFTPSNIIYVDDDAASGGDGSVMAPYRTIQDGINHAVPGTRVLVSDGLYHEAISFPASGISNNWIQVKAEGDGAILDGSATLSGNIWTPLEGKKNIWSTTIEAPLAYLARDQKRFYMYDDYQGLLDGLGHNRVAMNEGWYMAPGTTKLFVRSLDDPASRAWQVPGLNHAFDVEGRDWIWIEGLEIRFYGRQDGCGVCLKNSSHVVIRKNRIHNLQKGIFIEWTGGEAQGNDTRIEYNEISDPASGEWPWKAVKSTSMEGTAVIVRGHVGAIVRGNDVHHFFNGIYTGSSGAMENSALAFDADIYNNQIHHIADDALEPEGACINHRFRNNFIDSAYVGVSLAPVTQGPVWVMRSVFANYTGRGIKWDRNSDGVVFIYHNTTWTNAKSPNAMDFISPVHAARLRNNIFQSNGYAFESVPAGSTEYDSNNNNWHSTRSLGNPHFKWGNINYTTMAQLCTATGLECNGYEDPPGLTNPQGGDFTLLPSSPNVDRGVIIPGINDGFSGSGPDAGAYEFAHDSPPILLSNVRADANPASAAVLSFTLTFSESVTGVDLVPPFNDFALVTSPAISGAFVAGVTAVSGNTYTIRVDSGSGDGTIRLDLMDDDSIRDAAGNALGGAGAGNGNFTSGEIYTVEKNLPVVSGIIRANSSPSPAETVDFSVTFSAGVSGLDAGDFRLTTTGDIAGAAVATIEGSGSIYTVRVNTGTGDGTLRLDLQDDDSIRDVSNNPLNGPGAGNGSYTSGEIYTVDKKFPVVINSLRRDPDPAAAEFVSFSVIFSEPVIGVDAGDFVLTTTGDLSDAAVTSIGLGDLGTSYNVVVNTGAGSGSIRLDVTDDDSIVDAAGHPLGGAGQMNGSFAAGEVYTMNRPGVSKFVDIFRSNGTNDGWILESSEESNRGGIRNSVAATFNLGDNAQDRQYRAILHFPTASIPDNAVVTMAILMIKRQGLSGSDPFNTHQNILVDIRSGAFGSFGPFNINALQTSDFQDPASQDSAGMIQNNPVGGWYWALLDGTALRYVNLTGVTQFRLRFQMDDDDDRGDDNLKFFSGNHAAQPDRPQLQVEYYVPR